MADRTSSVSRLVVYGGGAVYAFLYFFIAAALTKTWLNQAYEGRPLSIILVIVAISIGAMTVARLSPGAGMVIGVGVIVLVVVGLALWSVEGLLKPTTTIGTLLVTGGQNPFIPAFGASLVSASLSSGSRR